MSGTKVGSSHTRVGGTGGSLTAHGNEDLLQLVTPTQLPMLVLGSEKAPPGVPTAFWSAAVAPSRGLNATIKGTVVLQTNLQSCDGGPITWENQGRLRYTSLSCRQVSALNNLSY